MIKTTVYESEFIRAFSDYNQEENFSYNGRIALFEYLENLSIDIGEPIELDVIALCCEYTEYKSLEEFNIEYNKECKTLEEVEHFTTVIPISDSGFIIQNF